MNIRLPRILFVLHQYRSFFIKILIAVCIDILVLSITLVWINIMSNASIVEIAIAPSLIVINLGFTIVARFTIRKLYLVLLFNILLAPFIFYSLKCGWSWCQEHENFRKWQFAANGKYYELKLDKRDTSYDISKITPGPVTEFMRGQYKISNDSTQLIDIVSPMVVYKDTLTGFQKEKIALRKD